MAVKKFKVYFYDTPESGPADYKFSSGRSFSRENQARLSAIQGSRKVPQLACVLSNKRGFPEAGSYGQMEACYRHGVRVKAPSEWVD